MFKEKLQLYVPGFKQVHHKMRKARWSTDSVQEALRSVLTGKKDKVIDRQRSGSSAVRSHWKERQGDRLTAFRKLCGPFSLERKTRCSTDSVQEAVRSVLTGKKDKVFDWQRSTDSVQKAVRSVLTGKKDKVIDWQRSGSSAGRSHWKERQGDRLTAFRKLCGPFSLERKTRWSTDSVQEAVRSVLTGKSV